MATNTGMALAEFAVNIKYEALPEEVVDFAKGLTLKMVAGMVVGSTKPSSRKVASLIKARKLSAEASVIGHGFKTGLWEAVLLNSYFAHASELEDDSFIDGTGWDVSVIPPLVSLGEKLKLSGKALIEAIVAGLEVHLRTTIFPTSHLFLAIVPPAVGPAAGAAKAQGLNVKEMGNAMGLAASGNHMWHPSVGTHAHFFESALQALQGVMAADLAKEGLTGNSDVGLFVSGLLGKENVDLNRMVDGLGKRWLFRELWVKKYPCCWVTHRPIDVVIELRKKHHLSYKDVESIQVDIKPRDAMLCDRPQPKTETDLQFSFQNTLAAAMVDGDVNFEHFTEAALTRLEEARSKVKVVVHPEWTSPSFFLPAQPVIIKMKDGKEFKGERMYTIGSPNEPLTKEQFLQLYSKFTRGYLSEPAISKSGKLIMDLEKLGDVGELVESLALLRKA